MKVSYIACNSDFNGEMNANKTDFLVDPFIIKTVEGTDYHKLCKDNDICPVDIVSIQD